MDAVDWGILAKAMEHYQGAGYTAIEMPWFVPVETQMLTCPREEWIMKVDGHGGLVGSSEQSFIAADLAGTLGKGKFVACTPCFRNEPYYDNLHRVGFMKVELYRNDDVSQTALNEVMNEAARCMAGIGGIAPNLEKTPEGFDLTIGGIEVGSYGVRSVKGISWIYGTGIAEPRFSTAVRMRREALGGWHLLPAKQQV